jgi:processive 1,2-diacylglycerol beta-glucosyltransferase
VFKRVLILSASAGAGHVRAGQALERAAAEIRAAEEVRHIDTLEYTTQLFRNLYSKVYIDVVGRAPDLLGWLYDRFDKPWKNERQRLAFDKLNTRPFVRLLEEYEPEIIICTHFLPAEIISWLKAKRRLACQQAIVVTDFDVHAMWLCHHFEHYFVALDEARAYLEKLGIPSSKIAVSGIPIDPVFAQRKNKLEMREKHGLSRDRTTLLVSAGGFGLGSLTPLMTALLELRHPAQIIAICGRNQALKRRLEQLANDLPVGHRVGIKVVGYTQEMDEYMTAADIVVGKPGGLTTSEALAKGLVSVIVNPIPGQEERNSDHLLEEGVGIRCNNLPVLAYKIDRLIDDPQRLASMQANALQLARPQAARAVLEKLLLLKKQGHGLGATTIRGRS